MTKITSERVLSIFSELNQIPRPSHHEERVADYLCQFAQRLQLDYERDPENCVVIRKPATLGYEASEPIVLLNHMDMVCVGMSAPLNAPIVAYVEDGWMKARGTSLGADNGIGLSMALAVLENDSIAHPALEVITTTNEEDGMSGAAQLSKDFLQGRKVINLDSEDYDTITTGAAGACLLFHRLPMQLEQSPIGQWAWYSIRFEGGLGGHSGVDINKGRCSAAVAVKALLEAIGKACDYRIANIQVGEANASIASTANLTICVPTTEAVVEQEKYINKWIRHEYPADANLHCTIQSCDPQDKVITKDTVDALLCALAKTPQGVVKMSEVMQDTVETSNNIGRIVTESDHLFVSTHTRSFIDAVMEQLSKDIASNFASVGASSETIMSAPAWQEDQHSPFLQLTSDTFLDVLGWRPRMVAMHFVLEAGFFVQHYPGIQMASIGPRIVEPHSASERVEMKTIDDIWQVLLELLKRLK